MSIFKNGFVEPNVNFPDKILIPIINDFSKITNGLAELTLIELDKIQKISVGGLNNTFQFRVVLTSSFLKGYSFTVFDFGYDVSIYPVFIDFEEVIGEELGIRREVFKYINSYNNEDEFKTALGGIFNSKVFKETVGGLMKIARSKMEEKY
jgi:hypothetical protein